MHTGNASASNAERNALTFLFFRFSPYVSIFETPSRILSYRRSVSSLLFLTLHESSFHRIYVCFEILPIGTYVSRLIGLPMQPPLLRYTLRMRKHKCARSFPSLPLLSSSPTLMPALSCLSLTNTPNHRYWMLHLFNDRHELSNKFFISY